MADLRFTYLLTGDVLLNDGSHMNIEIETEDRARATKWIERGARCEVGVRDLLHPHGGPIVRDRGDACDVWYGNGKWFACHIWPSHALQAAEEVAFAAAAIDVTKEVA